jgi:hypothetical protein
MGYLPAAFGEPFQALLFQLIFRHFLSYFPSPLTSAGSFRRMKCSINRIIRVF